MMPKQKLFFSTEMVDPDERDECWRDISSIVYEVDPWDRNGIRELHGTVSSRLFGSMVVGRTTFNDQECRRSRQLVVCTDRDLCVIQLVLAGVAQGDYDGQDTQLKPGDVLVHDLTQVMSAHVSTGERLAIIVNRSELRRRVSRRSLHGIVLDGTAPVTRLVADYILGLDRVLLELQESEVPATEEALLLLLANAINGRTTEWCDELPSTAPMRQRIIDFINNNVADPALDPSMIMARFRLSRSHLYRAFEADGGIARFIRERRLDLAYKLLFEKGARELSIKEVIYRCGLSENVQFSKFFKDRFGLPPHEIKDQNKSRFHTKNGPHDFHNYLYKIIRKF
ncbi:AraC family transcriptional regulator [Castellaniella sp.]|uniref:AraC family transcriptional regulator n=1 Tax=Castellaniella sp. TaxID=1955812 RepID=UPI002AFDDC26|nr:AraC family transcriptional regulator [Castellaniella sp.]